LEGGALRIPHRKREKKIRGYPSLGEFGTRAEHFRTTWVKSRRGEGQRPLLLLRRLRKGRRLRILSGGNMTRERGKKKTDAGELATNDESKRGKEKEWPGKCMGFSS